MGNYFISAGVLKVRLWAFEFAHIVIMPNNDFLKLAINVVETTSLGKEFQWLTTQ